MSAPSEAEERRVGRLRAGRHHRLADARADEEAAGEAGERRGADHEALEVARDRRRERQRDNDPVEGGHGGRAGYPPRRLEHAAEVSRGARTGRTTSAANGAETRRPPPARRRRARSQRLVAVLALCGFAFVVGLVVGARHKPAGQAHAERFAAAWERGDYAAMYSELTAGRPRPRARARASPPPTRTRCAPRPRRRSTPAEPRKDGERLPRAGPHPHARVRHRRAARSSCPTTRRRASTGRARLVFPGPARGRAARAA